MTRIRLFRRKAKQMPADTEPTTREPEQPAPSHPSEGTFVLALRSGLIISKNLGASFPVAADQIYEWSPAVLDAPDGVFVATTALTARPRRLTARYTAERAPTPGNAMLATSVVVHCPVCDVTDEVPADESAAYIDAHRCTAERDEWMRTRSVEARTARLLAGELVPGDGSSFLADHDHRLDGSPYSPGDVAEQDRYDGTLGYGRYKREQHKTAGDGPKDGWVL